MIRRLALALVIAALVGLAPAARADGPGSVSYADLGNCGVLTLSGAAGTQFVVRAELADGSYAVVWGGTLGYQPVSKVVAEPGPVGNGQPQFTITYTGPDGSQYFTINDPGLQFENSDRWYVE